MKGTNLISLLQTFTKDEFRHFGKFVRSPFFNTHKDVIRYYDTLVKYFPGFDKKGFTKENIFSAVYPGRKYSNNDLLKLNSAMNHLATEFLKHLPEEFDDDYKLLNQLVSRKLEKQFFSHYKKLNDYLDNTEEIENMTFVKKIFLQNAFIHFNLNRDRQKDICETVVERGNNFAYQSLLWATIQFRDMKANFNTYNYPYEDSFANYFIGTINFEEILGRINFEDNRIGRYLDYYFSSFLMFLYPQKKKYYTQFRTSFKKIIEEVNQPERHNYLARFHTYTTMKLNESSINEGKIDFLDESLKTYKYFFRRNDLSQDVFKDNIIPVPAFRNSLTLALLAKDMKFAGELLDNYISRINTEYKEDVKRIGCAGYYFAIKEFGKVKDYLKRFSYKYPQHKADVRQLYLKTYYELKEYETVFSYADSFRHFLHKFKPLTDKQKNRYGNLINCIQKLTEMKLSTDKQAIKYDSGLMKKEIYENKIEMLIQDKIWLTEKLSDVQIKS